MLQKQMKSLLHYLKTKGPIKYKLRYIDWPVWLVVSHCIHKGYAVRRGDWVYYNKEIK